MQNTFLIPNNSLPAIPIFVAVIWAIVWLVTLAFALIRKDLDPVTRLTWVLVIIFVPFFGVVFYWTLGLEKRTALAGTKSSSPVSQEFQDLCGKCAHFTKTGILDAWKGHCGLHSRTTYKNYGCKDFSGA